MKFWQGETARFRATFTDEAGAPMAAVGVQFVARAPSGRLVQGSAVAAEGVGLWYADFPLNEPGIWFLRAFCTGPTPAADEAAAEVRASMVILGDT